MPAIIRFGIGWGSLLVFLTACQPPSLKPDGSPVFTAEEKQLILSLSPLPSPPSNPSNRYVNDAKVAHFGQRLFYEPRLSAQRNLQCASCHNPALGWSDGKALAMGLKTGVRHTPSLWNVAHQRWLFWDGRADSLWSQAIQPIENPLEMGLSRQALYQRFQQETDLRHHYETAFGALPPQNPDGTEQLAAHIGKALEAFQRKIMSSEAPFDRFVRGLRQQDESAQKALSPAAQKGLRLFIGRAQCVLCHTGPLFSDGEFHNIGLPTLSNEVLDQGRFEGIAQLKRDPFNGLGRFSDLPHADDPWADKLHYLEQQPSNRGEFRTPSLREVSRTAPYFHDGRFTQLEQVVGYYNAPQTPALGRREDTLQPLRLNAEDIADLVAFLKSLESGPPAEALTRQP